jgi:hypothetical protein
VPIWQQLVRIDLVFDAKRRYVGPIEDTVRFCSLLLLLPSTGCCLGAAAWPVADVTPPVKVGADDVRAYRSEITTKGGWVLGLRGQSPESVEVQVPVREGRLERQANCKMDWFLGLILAGAYQRHDLKLTLERPGYKTLEVDSWPWWFPLGYLGSRSCEWEAWPTPGETEKKNP